jgi:hypothetical protein
MSGSAAPLPDNHRSRGEENFSNLQKWGYPPLLRFDPECKHIVGNLVKEKRAILFHNYLFMVLI